MKSARARRSFSSTFSTPRSCGAFRRQIGIERDDAHLQALGAVGDDGADIAGADQAQHLAGDLDAHEAVLFPLAGLRGGVGGGKFARQRQHQRDGVLGGGDRIAERRVHHDHAGGGGGRNIDIVDADAGAADDLQVLRGLDDIGGDLGRRADGDAVILIDDLEQFFLAQSGLHVGFDAALLEDGDGGGRQFVGDQNLGHGTSSSVQFGVVAHVERRGFEQGCRQSPSVGSARSIGTTSTMASGVTRVGNLR